MSGGEKGTTQRIPSWESELWSYVSSGDGTQCPLYDCCKVRQKEGWCPSDRIEQLGLVVDTRCRNLSDCDSIKYVTRCRIFELVEMLAQKYLRKSNIYYPPVPTELVSLADEQHRVEVRLVPLMVYHGAIWHLKDRWIVQVNKNDPPAIRRFTEFHEAFHILAHRKASPVFRKRGLKAGHFNELLAEHFASCMLMPKKWVREHWKESNDLSNMAETFDVPKSVACVRLKCLHLV